MVKSAVKQNHREKFFNHSKYCITVLKEKLLDITLPPTQFCSPLFCLSPFGETYMPETHK